MNCEKIKDLIFQRLVDEISEEESVLIEKHLEGCDQCRMEEEQLRQSIEFIKPSSLDSLTDIEKLRLENRMIKQMIKTKVDNSSSIAEISKRILAVAAAVVFFALGFGSRSLYQDSIEQNGDSSNRMVQNSVTDQKIVFSGSQRMSPQGLLLIAKGKKAIEKSK